MQPIDFQYLGLLSKTDMEITTIEIQCSFTLIQKEPDVHFKSSDDHISIEFPKHQDNRNKKLYTATSLVSHLS